MSELAARNFGEHGRHFKTADALIEALIPELNPDATVLVKGSRFMSMERISDSLAVNPEETV